MQTHNLGYPRIGNQRELKKACEKYWAGEISENELQIVGREIRRKNWQLQIQAEIDIIPCNDFSFYDNVLDHIMTFNIIPKRFREIETRLNKSELYFALARGIQRDELDVTAMEMSKWFDTNYHYIVPEFDDGQKFSLSYQTFLDNYKEAVNYGIRNPKVVIIGPFSLLKLGKSKNEDIEPLSLMHFLLPLYIELIGRLSNEGVRYIQIDEPFLCTMLSGYEQKTIQYAIAELVKSFPDLHFILATYFGSVTQNKSVISQWSGTKLTLHFDLSLHPEQLSELLNIIPDDMNVSLGLVNGRNIWKNDFSNSLKIIFKAAGKLGTDRLMIAPSCSLLHVPCDLDNERNGKSLPSEVKQWMSFAKQKLYEVHTLSELYTSLKTDPGTKPIRLVLNAERISNRRNSSLVNNNTVREREKNITANDFERGLPYSIRRTMQQKELNLPLFPSTTIGSFPQIKEVRSIRAKYKKGEMSGQ
jgi:5-methyltetrahydropteroyltriglutamate--homocysteine methyltransferase